MLFAQAALGQSRDFGTFETGVERDVNQYRWIANAALSQHIGAWRLDATNRFTSDAYILFAHQLSFRDENRLDWTLARPLSPRFALRLRGTSGVFTQSRVVSQDLFAGLRYVASGHLWIEPALGAALDRRPGVGPTVIEAPLRLDAGPAVGVRSLWTPPPLNGYELTVRTDASWQSIRPRRGHAVRIDGSGRRSFNETHLSAQVAYASVRRDAYQAVSFLNRGTPTDRLSETVEATTSDTLLARLDLDAPVAGRLKVVSSVDLSLNDRAVRTRGAPDDALFFDTRFSRRAFETETALQYDAPALSAAVVLRGGAEVERRQLTNRTDLSPTQATQKANLLEQADYDQGYFNLQARLRADAGHFSFSADGSSRILRHDTPEANLDDRDEVFHNASLGALVQLSRYLEANVRVFGSFYHTVYLNAERSAENNVQRSLRLRPTVRWLPSDETTIALSSEIRATYTVDDFVLQGRRPTDQSAREIRYDGSIDHDFGSGVRVLATGSLSSLHLGRLLWDQFAEIPSDTLHTYNGWIRLQVNTLHRVTAEVGFRLFVRSDFDRATNVRYPLVDDAGAVLRDADGNALTTTITRPGRKRIEQLGPTASIVWPMRNGASLRLDGWLDVQHVRQHLYGTLPPDDAPRIRRYAHQGQRTLIPNVALTTTWRL